MVRDWSLQVGPYPIDAAADHGLPLGERTDSTILPSDFDDVVYIGYYQDGTNNGDNFGNITFSGNVTTSESQKMDGTLTDGYVNHITIDLAGGDDQLKLKGHQGGDTTVYLGEGNDTYIVGGNVSGPNSFVFAEAGDDTVAITDLLGTSTGATNMYMGSGSDTVSASDFIWGTLDLGSGNTMPTGYKAFYKDGVTSLGNDNNTDEADAVNNVTFMKQLGFGTNGVNILGGAGQDHITATNIVGSYTTISLGSNDDSVTANTYITNATIQMGEGVIP